jgi:hypothetical protein
MRTGANHEYLGIDFEFKTSKDLQVSMVVYLKEVIMGFPELIVGNAAMLAGGRLFDMQDEKDARLLEEERAIAFHHTMAQPLFMATRACWDIQTVVAFLTTRAKALDEDDWGKLQRVLQCLNGTKYLKSTISVKDLAILKWYVDGSHNVHWDCKGRTRAMFTLGEGAASSYSRKLKINTRSSTETELMGADLYMPEMLWSSYFIQSQGYDMKTIKLYQDNRITELLMKNGRFSSGKSTKHIKAKFFFIRDRIDSREMRVKHQPTEEMWVNILTTPLQRTAFRKMHAKLMNCKENYEEDKIAFKHSMAKAVCARKPIPATGRVAK